jgi:hypothetical protein
MQKESAKTKVEKELHPTLSKLTEEQFAKLDKGFAILGSIGFDGFYPTLNLELLTKCMKEVNQISIDLTDEEFIFIIKQCGSVSYFISVSGSVDVTAVNFDDERYNIPAEKIEEFGVDKIQGWRNFDNIAEIIGSPSWEEGQRFIDEDTEVGSVGSPPELSEVKVFTKVNVVIPTLNVFAEKEVNL